MGCEINEGLSLMNEAHSLINEGFSLMNEGFSLISYHLSDVGNAERLIALYGSDIRFNHLQGKFYIWNGRYWQADNKGEIFKLAKSTIRRLEEEEEAIDGNGGEELKELKKRLKSFVLRSENDSRLRAMVNQTRSQPGLSMGEIDKDPYVLNMKNGTLDLRTGALYPHRRSDYITKLINIDYDEGAKCQNWREFIDKIFDNDSELIDYVQRSVGYSLTGSQEDQCFYILYGSGANGKSTFLNTIKMILSEYSDTLKSSSLMVHKYDDGARGDLAKLKGKRLVTASELNEGQTFDESMMKALTGGETVPVRFLYSEEFQLVSQFKIWISTNEKPKIKGTNDGIWRRVRLIPFLHTFTKDEIDEKFFEKYLLHELPGILNWTVEGCLKWQRERIKIPQRIEEAINNYKSEMDSVQRFIEDCCITGDLYTVRISRLYDSYCRWCKEAREREMSSIKFSKKIREKGFEQGKDRYSRFWDGIATMSMRG